MSELMGKDLDVWLLVYAHLIFLGYVFLRTSFLE